MPPRKNNPEGGAGQWVKKADGPGDDGAPAEKKEGGEKPQKGRGAGNRRGKGRGKQSKTNPEVDEKEVNEDGTAGPNLTLDKDAANRMILHHTGIPKDKLAEAQANNAAERAKAEDDEDSVPISGRNLLDMLKANPPKVTRYTKGELLSIRQLPASKVRPTVLDKLVDKENNASPLLLRNQGKDGEDGEEDGEGRPRRERRSRKQQVEQPQPQAEGADSGDDEAAAATAPSRIKTVHKNSLPKTHSVSAASATGASPAVPPGVNTNPDPQLSDMLFMDEDADVSETSRGYGKWFGEKAGAPQKEPASAKAAGLQKSIAAALAGSAGQNPASAKGGGPQGFPPGHPGAGALGFPLGHPQAGMPGMPGMPAANPYAQAAYAQAYAQAMMAQGYGRGIPPGAMPPPGWPYPGYPYGAGPYGHPGFGGYPPGTPTSAAAAAAAAGLTRPPGQNKPKESASTAKAEKATKQKKQKGQAAQGTTTATLGASLAGGSSAGAGGGSGAMQFSQALSQAYAGGGLASAPPASGAHKAEDSDDEAGCQQQ